MLFKIFFAIGIVLQAFIDLFDEAESAVIMGLSVDFDHFDELMDMSEEDDLSE